MPATGVVVAKVHEPQTLPKNVLRAKIKADIFEMRYYRVENKYYLGKKYWQLQQLHGKAGHGTFLEDLQELSTPTTTAYRYINFFKAVYLGFFDPTPQQMTKAQTDKLLATTEGSPPEKSLEMTADEERVKVAAAIAAAKQHIAKSKTKHKGEAGGYNVKCVFTVLERTKFKEKYKGLGIKEVSKIIYEAVMSATA